MLCCVGVTMGGWLNLFRQSSKRKERTKRISDCGAESGNKKKDEGDTWNEKLFWYIFSHFVSCVHILPVHMEKSSNFARISQKKIIHILFTFPHEMKSFDMLTLRVLWGFFHPPTTTTTWTLFYISFSFHPNFSTIRICKSCCASCQIFV